jgi:hypothetical protein
MRQQKRQLVTSDNHRTALRGTGTQRSHDRLGIARRISGVWFVRKQHRGVACERQGHSAPPALAARERGWFRAQAIGDAKLHGDLESAVPPSVTRCYICCSMVRLGNSRCEPEQKNAATCQIAE